MKISLNLFFFLSITALLSIWSCGKNVEPSLTEQQKAAKVLDEGSAWGGSGKVEVIELPAGVNPAGLAELRLVFDTTGDPDWLASSFSASGADDFLATSGASWDWADKDPERTDVIKLEEATSSELTNMSISETEIQFTFQVTSPGGRVEGLDGLYTLKMLPN
jgi:hypothetical protein